MRRMLTPVIVALLVIPALPAGAAKPIVSDAVELTWEDGDYVRYADGVVDLSMTETSFVDCAGASAVQTTTIIGETAGLLEMKNHLRSGTLTIEPSGLVVLVEGGCDIATPSAGPLVIELEFIGSTVERTKTETGRMVRRTGSAWTTIADSEVSAVVERRWTRG